MKHVLLMTVWASLVAVACGSQKSIQESNLESGLVSNKKIYVGDFTVLNLDSHLPVTGDLGASITINQKSKSATIFIPNCPVGAMCIWGGPSYTATILSDKIDSCGAHKIIAKTDRRPVDGELTEITVNDFSNSTCEGAPSAFKLYATLETSIVSRTSGASSTHSTFKGTEGLSQRPVRN